MYDARTGGGGPVSFHDGFDEADSIAFGLAAPQLMAVVAAFLLALLIERSSLARPLAIPVSMAIVAAGVTLGWLRFHDRPLLHWMILGARFLAAPTVVTLTVIGGRAQAAPTVGTQPLRTDWVESPKNPGGRQPAQGPSASWAQWLEDAPSPPPAAGGSSVSPPSSQAEPPTTSPEPGDDDDLDDLEPFDESDTDIDEDGPEADLQDERGVILPFARANQDETPAPLQADAAPTVGNELLVEDVHLRSALPTAFVGATRRLTFFSLNGGSGKTTLATEVGCFLASQGQHTRDGLTTQRLKVALLDLDCRSSSVSVRLGIPQPTIWDYVMDGEAQANAIDDYMVTHVSGLHALLGPPKPITSPGAVIEPQKVADIVQQLERDGYHYVIFDINGELNELNRWVLSTVHDIYIVLTPTASGVQDAYRTTEVLRRLGLRHKLGYVLNRCRTAVNLSTTMADLGGRVLAEIPEDAGMDEAENRHQPMVMTGGPAATAIRQLGGVIFPGLLTLPPRRRLQLPALPWRRRRAG